MKLEFSRHIFEKYSNIQFHKHPFSGNRVVPCRRKDRQVGKQTNATKQTVAFRNFGNAPRSNSYFEILEHCSDTGGVCIALVVREMWNVH
jgi:hypothetical protein